MIPRFKPFLNWRELAAAFSLPRRDDVARFEDAFAAKMGQKHAIAFPYGRTGIIMLFEALALKGKQIICPAYTCVVVAHAIMVSGNEPVFVDSTKDDFNMDLDQVPEFITERTGAIIATSIFGYPVDLDKLDEIRKRFPGVVIIQDCAHSFAAEWKGRPVQREGKAAIFALNISKMITSVFGGMVTTDDTVLADRLRTIRDKELKPASFAKNLRRLFYLVAVYPAFWEPVYGFINRLERSGLLNRFVKYYDEGVIDMPADYLEQMASVEARVGMVQLSKYETIITNKRANASRYFDIFKNISELQLPHLNDGATYSHFTLLVPERSSVVKEALKDSIQLGILIEYCIPQMSVYKEYSNGEEFPHSSRFAQHTLNLPVYAGLSTNSSVFDRLYRVLSI